MEGVATRCDAGCPTELGGSTIANALCLRTGPDAVVVGEGMWDGERLVPDPALLARARAVEAALRVQRTVRCRDGRSR